MKKINIPVNQVRVAKEAEKEKHKGKPWKNMANSDKDYVLFLLCKEAGIIPADMEFE